MAFKTILAITAINQSDRDLRLVADLCDETLAHMSVLVLAFAAPPPVGNMPRWRRPAGPKSEKPM